MNNKEISSTKLKEQDKPLIGFSSCLLGNEVRFDGGHKHEKFITQQLNDYLDFQVVCPEVESGLSIPRPAMQLQRVDQEIRMVVSKDPANDVTQRLQTYSEQKLPQLDNLDGFIFKKGSPSCGLFRVAITNPENGYKDRTGRGIFAQNFTETYPNIPVEEEGRLYDADLRENFFERVYAYARWKKIEDPLSNVQGFIEFHSCHKFLLMARGSHYYQELGRMVSGTTKKDLSERRQAYINRFSQVMKKQPHRGMQVNVLQHILGYIKEQLSASDKKELLAVFESYRNQKLPLITPVTLLKHYLRLYPEKYILKQHYLDPYPESLALRSFH